MTTSLPLSFKFGKVVGRVIQAVGDGSQDPDSYPDGIPISGKGLIIFTPSVDQATAEDSTGVTNLIRQSRIDADLNADGVLYLSASSTEQGVWLYTGTWQVSFGGSLVGLPSFPIYVTEENTADNPLDLFAQMSVPLPPGTPVFTLVVPQNGSNSDVLTWSSDDNALKWVSRSSFPDQQSIQDAQAAATSAKGFRDESQQFKEESATNASSAYTAQMAAEAARDEIIAVGSMGKPLNDADLNTIQKPGMYYQDTESLATSTRNYPLSTTSSGPIGMLEVFRVANQRYIQVFTPSNQTSVTNIHTRYSSPPSSGGDIQWGLWVNNGPTIQENVLPIDYSKNSYSYVFNGHATMGITGRYSMVGKLLNGWTASWLDMYRQDNVVHLIIMKLSCANATFQVFLSLPYGFRPITTMVEPVPNGSGFTNIYIDNTTLSCGKSLPTARYTIPDDSYIGYDLSWTTENPWPTTRPDI